MTQLKLSITITGEDFDVKAFRHGCKDPEMGTVLRRVEKPPVLSKIPGTSRSYDHWISNSKFISLKQFTDLEYASHWLEEEQHILNYLDEIFEKIPDVKLFCKGEYSKVLIVVYLETEERYVGGFFFSPKLYKKLSDLSLFMELILRKDE
jgi:hypothetical protein